MTHTLESEDTPPPMPSSWRMFGSGEPMTARKIGSHASRERGRSRARKMIALDVPPRMKTAGSLFCGIGHLAVRPDITRTNYPAGHVFPGLGRGLAERRAGARVGRSP